MANETMDFLTALASRNSLAAGETPPAVQPRIPSRFEPITPDAGAWLTESSAEIEATREERRAAQGRNATPANAPSATTPSSTIAPSPAQTARSTPPAAHPALRAIERVVHERETQTIRIVERERQTPNTPAPAMATRDESTATPAPQPAPAQPTNPASQPQPIPQTSTLAPKPPAATKPSTTPAEKTPAAPQMPDVHISIGRIEVRAGTAAKKSEPAKSRPTAPNLECYLNALSGNSGENG